MECPVINGWESERLGEAGGGGGGSRTGWVCRARGQTPSGEQVLKFVRPFSPYRLFSFLLLGNICVTKEMPLKWRNYFDSVKP